MFKGSTIISFDRSFENFDNQEAIIDFARSLVNSKIIKEDIQTARKKEQLKAFDNLKLEYFDEGASAKIMHIGPFSEEHANIMKLYNAISKNVGKFDGQFQKHHEIYLSDFRKTAPEKMRTVLRQLFVNE